MYILSDLAMKTTKYHSSSIISVKVSSNSRNFISRNLSQYIKFIYKYMHRSIVSVTATTKETSWMSIDRGLMNKLLYIHIVKFCTSLKKKDLNVLVWKAVQTILLSKKSILQNNMLAMLPFSWIHMRVSQSKEKIWKELSYSNHNSS